jgi:hypothetical protein
MIHQKPKPPHDPTGGLILMAFGISFAIVGVVSTILTGTDIGRNFLLSVLLVAYN